MMRSAFGLLVLLALCLGAGASAEAAARTPYLEELTWTELHDVLAAGITTIIVPVGGTEQSGPHLALGKHNGRVKVLSGRIASALGDTLVAPVLAYVPEGNVMPPTEHMRFPGTISVPVAAFKGMLEGAAQSFKQAGFTQIVLIGDHGGYQTQLKEVAERLDRQWAGTPVRAHFIAAYYNATQAAYRQALRAKGLSDAEIGTHAGAADTSLELATNPEMVRPDRLTAAPDAKSGVEGDPRRANVELGRIGVDLIVNDTVAAIKKARLEKH